MLPESSQISKFSTLSDVATPQQISNFEVMVMYLEVRMEARVFDFEVHPLSEPESSKIIPVHRVAVQA